MAFIWGMLGGADSPIMRGLVKVPLSIKVSLSVGLTYRFIGGLLRVMSILEDLELQLFLSL
jgi:hypothetical protein